MKYLLVFLVICTLALFIGYLYSSPDPQIDAMLQKIHEQRKLLNN